MKRNSLPFMWHIFIDGQGILWWISDQQTAQCNPNGERNWAMAGTILYNGMLHPFVDYHIKGAIWYQGESNRNNASQYADLYPAMIKSWRNLWNIGDCVEGSLFNIAGLPASPFRTDDWLEWKVPAKAYPSSSETTTISYGRFTLSSLFFLNMMNQTATLGQN